MEINIAYFNCNGFKGFMPFLSDLLIKCDVLCLQEVMLTKQDCYLLNTCNDSYVGWGVSPVDASCGILSGRPYGGVGFFMETLPGPIYYHT